MDSPKGWIGPLALLIAGTAAAQEAAGPEERPQIVAPSGLVLSLQEVRWEPETRQARLRFVAPDLGGPEPMQFSEVAGDFLWLCETWGVPALEQNGLDGAGLVISIADRDVEFGVMDADAVQFFEGYSVGDDGACNWEPY